MKPGYGAHTLVILTEREGGWRFYTGGGWGAEYPDAKKFRDETMARLQAQGLTRDKGVATWVIRDYGFENETTVATYEPKARCTDCRDKPADERGSGPCLGCGKETRSFDHRVYFGVVGPFCCVPCRNRWNDRKGGGQ